jgi:hypothetical protein
VVGPFCHQALLSQGPFVTRPFRRCPNVEALMSQGLLERPLCRRTMKRGEEKLHFTVAAIIHKCPITGNYLQVNEAWKRNLRSYYLTSPNCAYRVMGKKVIKRSPILQFYCVRFGRQLLSYVDNELCFCRHDPFFAKNT